MVSVSHVHGRQVDPKGRKILTNLLTPPFLEDGPKTVQIEIFQVDIHKRHLEISTRIHRK